MVTNKKRATYLVIIAILLLSLGFHYHKNSKLQETIQQYEQELAEIEKKNDRHDSADETRSAEEDNQQRVGSDSAILGSFKGVTLAEWQLRAYPFTPQEVVANLLTRADLIPYKAVFGGTMHFVPDKIVILTHNWVLAYFEDGHIHGNLLLQFGVNRQNQLTWEVIDSWLPGANEEVSNVPSDKEVVDLVFKAFERHWYTRFNDNPNKLDIFMLQGTEYRYLSPNIDTEGKMLAYLQEVYTSEVSQQLYGSYGYQQHNGRFYHQPGELGTLYAWKKAEPTLLYKKNNRALYQLKVPVGDFIEEKQVELVYLIDRGWRVNTVIDY